MDSPFAYLISLFLVVFLYYLFMYYVPSTILYFPYYLCLHGMIQYILGTSPTKTKKTFGTSTTNNKTTGTNSLFSCYGGAFIGKFTDGGILLLYRNSLSKYSIIHINTKNYKKLLFEHIAQIVNISIDKTLENRY